MESATMDKQHRTRESEKHAGSSELLCRLAHLVLPYLDAAGLVSVSATCKALHVISNSITSRRISDASRSSENHPIPFFNSVDSQLYDNFMYSPVQTLPSESGRVRSDPFLFRIEGAQGCTCESCDLDSDNCPCVDFDSGLPTRECGPSCSCGLECGNRLTQKGISVKLKVVMDRRKGWSLCADELIPKGKFICEYTGELLTTEEARNRQKLYDKISRSSHFSPALLVVKEHLPSGNVCMRINIDATRIGNIARFINHSCDGGNLCTLIVRSSGALLPRVCFFSSRVILENEELTFSYGESIVNSTGAQCFCNSACCRGILPAEHT
ncbi:putative 50S ribosomal protein L25-like [Capsicum annuum]|uniref:histone-lysine N-methyltransferase SUVR3 n=1 Tax=Capsicum annuum TaxID=4072 RepID=UPI0007BF7617|nr:histone-lysine N-methyltransferase SUVR3 [Capsicum annuum]KAF3615242.1 putative 50S ribosomal protein L25-like [Capsicum annuum]KAF3630366.1 putative 50S ribosomal protein L25-like [Capsicum annuum]